MGGDHASSLRIESFSEWIDHLRSVTGQEVNDTPVMHIRPPNVGCDIKFRETTV